MTFDIVSVAGMIGFATAAVWFLARPRRADELRARLPKRVRGRGTEDEFFPFRRWTWTTLPSHWVSALWTSAVGGVVFAAMAIWFSLMGIGLFPVPAILAVILPGGENRSQGNGEPMWDGEAGVGKISQAGG